MGQSTLARQVYFEGRTARYFGVDCYETSALSDNPVNRGQTQAGSFSHLLGRKKWIEDARHHFRANAGAGVRNADHGEGTGWHTRMRAGTRLVKFDIVRLNHQLATVRHGVAGIDGEVHEDLVNLRGVSLHRPQLRIQR